MKKSRIFMAAGAAVLAISAVFATKANKKFLISYSTAYLQAASGPALVYGSQIFTTHTWNTGAHPTVPVFCILYTETTVTKPAGQSIGGELFQGTKQIYVQNNGF
jgi:hypothetical protein